MKEDKPAGGSRDVEGALSPKRKKVAIAATAAAIVVIAAAGFWTWHEQPSFCGAICHVPMDEYLATYEQEPGTQGTDKYGNEVSNTSAMLAVSHKAAANGTCLDCHQPVLSEQVSEGISWAAGSYSYPLYERTGADLTEARGEDSDAFCLNESCHDLSRDDLRNATADLAFNPHDDHHGQLDCTSCHKAHRASVMYCSECHSEAEVPDGWISPQEEKELRFGQETMLGQNEPAFLE